MITNTNTINDQNKTNLEIFPNQNKSTPSPQNSKNLKIIIIILTIITLLITILTIVLVFCLKESKSKKRARIITKEKNEDNTILPPLVLNSTSGNHTHTIIFLPGLTNTPEDFKIVFTDRLHFKKINDTKVVILRSPLVYVSYFNSTNYSWFDIYNFPMQNDSDYNFTDLKKSAKILETVITNEANILNGKYENIIIGGHSQGACISLYHGYNTDKNLGGLFSFSGVLPPGDIREDKNDFKVYFGYGDKDNIILPSFFNESIQRIKDFKEFKLYVYKDHLHYVNDAETDDVSEFLNNIIK